jgi:hypothetical protein
MIYAIFAVLGTVNFFVDARSDFDPWTAEPTPAQIQFMRTHYDRMQTYSPYFDDRLAWFPNAWVYRDSMAIKPAQDVFQEHPEWILRDAAGSQLYVDFDCGNGTCPQFAADIGNPAYRAWWIGEARRLINEVGYRGIWVDDVNLEWRISNGRGERVIPLDPRTSQPMSLTDWRRYFAVFMEELRAALPGIEIAHNSIWYADFDEFVERQIRASDYINIERGISDDGITPGNGKYGFGSFLAFVDRVHAMGKSIIVDDDDDAGERERDYDLAFYLLTKQNHDLLSADGDRSRMNPDSFWQGYRADLGEAGGRYYKNGTAYRRDFQCGYVIVDPPPSSTGRIVTNDCDRPAPPANILVR